MTYSNPIDRIKRNTEMLRTSSAANKEPNNWLLDASSWLVRIIEVFLGSIQGAIMSEDRCVNSLVSGASKIVAAYMVCVACIVRFNALLLTFKPIVRKPSWFFHVDEVSKHTNVL
tara:strand:+ start:14070 stop:14414 length:345 start_codon:yes stop_codon:yes gene_type:complete